MSTSGTIRTGIGGWTFEPLGRHILPRKIAEEAPIGARQPAGSRPLR